ncbi:MAG TPA: DUF6644 family protein [Vicinamibacterales bacterium]|nr:DUF6644 family protein [Vicinamibacterales bacterium]
MELLPCFEWIEATSIGNAIRRSLWLFPVIEAIHLLGLCVLGGAVLIVDLRMLGVGLRGYPIPQIARDARPWFLGALAVMLATGSALFTSEAVKCYYNTSFWVKITTLPFAVMLTIGIRDPMALRASLDATPSTRAVGMTSIALWVIVAAAGRWIGFSG